MDAMEQALLHQRSEFKKLREMAKDAMAAKDSAKVRRIALFTQYPNFSNSKESQPFERGERLFPSESDSDV